MASRAKTSALPAAVLGGVAVEYDDSTAPGSYGLVRVIVEAQASLSAAGVAAFLAQASTYLASAKVTALQAAGATVIVDVTARAMFYSVLNADSAAQVTALQALVTGANVTQTGGFPR